jgi:hypothetical protein
VDKVGSQRAIISLVEASSTAKHILCLHVHTNSIAIFFVKLQRSDPKALQLNLAALAQAHGAPSALNATAPAAPTSAL